MAAAEAEIARARVLELVTSGFEEVAAGDEVELAVYVDAEGEETMRSAFGGASAAYVEPGWEDAWRTFHRPVRAGGVWIGPPWEAVPADALAVVVDPGRAFGTGGHPTTRACIELLARTARGSVLDAGCGSGVVAVAAARLGFGPVYAVDVDPTAVEVATRTAEVNGVAVDVDVGDALADELPSVDLVVANIDVAIVESLLRRRPARTAIASGYLASERPRADGWIDVDRIELEGWAADLLVAG